MSMVDIESRMAELERLAAELQEIRKSISSVTNEIQARSVELDNLKESNRPLMDLKADIERARQEKKDWESQSDELEKKYNTLHHENDELTKTLQQQQQEERELADQVEAGNQDDERNGKLMNFYREKKEAYVRQQNKAKHDLANNQRILEDGKPIRQWWTSLVERAKRVQLQAKVSRELLEEENEQLRDEGLLERYRETFSDSELAKVQLLATGQLEAYLMQEE